MKAQDTLVQEFVHSGKRHGTASNMFIEGDTLYSYGHHFPLLVRMPWGFLQNADVYSSTTSHHQSMCFRHATALVPFSILREALRDSNHERWGELLRVVDKAEPRHDFTGTYYRIEDRGPGKRIKRHTISQKEYDELPEEQQAEWSPEYERRPEALILNHGDRYFLSSMDSNRYFMSELPEPVSTVREGFEALKPLELDESEQWWRQGEWFFQPCEIPETLIWERGDIKRAYKYLERNFRLPMASDSSIPHIATRGICLNGRCYVVGGISHAEHRTLRLSYAKDPRAFVAYHNRAIASWSPAAGGRARVD